MDRGPIQQPAETINECGGDRLVVRFTMTGTQRDQFVSIGPTGRSVSVDGITILWFRDGRCVERWSSVDMYAWLARPGAVPPPVV